MTSQEYISMLFGVLIVVSALPFIRRWRFSASFWLCWGLNIALLRFRSLSGLFLMASLLFFLAIPVDFCKTPEQTRRVANAYIATISIFIALAIYYYARIFI